MNREKLPARRGSVTLRVRHTFHSGREQVVLATYSPGSDNRVREVFCADFRAGDDMQSMVVDACVLISHDLQNMGLCAEDLAGKLCQPLSLIGTLVRQAAALDAEGYFNPPTEPEAEPEDPAPQPPSPAAGAAASSEEDPGVVPMGAP